MLTPSFQIPSTTGGSRGSLLRGLVVLTGLLLVCSGAPRAADWNAELEDGQGIVVDPTTNRALIQANGGEQTPLWDGVHRLSDGSVITVRSGLVVPNEEVLEVRSEEPAKPAPIPERSPACDELVLKTCGLKNECRGIQSCDLARQLRAMQWARGDQVPEDREWAESMCKKGLEDPEAFAACEAAAPSVAAPCQALVDHVCGSAQRCAKSAACRLAQQLLELEKEAESQGVTDHANKTREQCQQVLGEHAFFPPCR